MLAFVLAVEYRILTRAHDDGGLLVGLVLGIKWEIDRLAVAFLK